MAKNLNFNAANISKKWSKNLGAATDSIKAGVNAVTVAPGQKAVERIDAYLEGVRRSQEKWGQRVQAVTLQQWKDSMLNKGLNRIASGAQAAETKVAGFWNQFGPFLSQQVQSLDQTNPRGGFEENINRMVQNARNIHNFEYQR